MYKAQVLIHRSVLIYDYLRFQLHVLELQRTIRTQGTFLGLLNVAMLPPFVIPIVARV